MLSYRSAEGTDAPSMNDCVMVTVTPWLSLSYPQVVIYTLMYIYPRGHHNPAWASDAGRSQEAAPKAAQGRRRNVRQARLRRHQHGRDRPKRPASPGAPSTRAIPINVPSSSTSFPGPSLARPSGKPTEEVRRRRRGTALVAVGRAGLGTRDRSGHRAADTDRDDRVGAVSRIRGQRTLHDVVAAPPAGDGCAAVATMRRGPSRWMISS